MGYNGPPPRPIPPGITVVDSDVDFMGGWKVITAATLFTATLFSAIAWDRLSGDRTAQGTHAHVAAAELPAELPWQFAPPQDWVIVPPISQSDLLRHDDAFKRATDYYNHRAAGPIIVAPPKQPAAKPSPEWRAPKWLPGVIALAVMSLLDSAVGRMIDKARERRDRADWISENRPPAPQGSGGKAVDLGTVGFRVSELNRIQQRPTEAMTHFDKIDWQQSGMSGNPPPAPPQWIIG